MTESSIIGLESFIIIIVCIICGLRLVFSPKVRQSTYKRYRITCYCLAGACACLAIGNSILLAKFGLKYMPTEVCSIISTTISASQSLLFTIALIVLYTSQKVKYTHLLFQTVPILGFVLLYFIASRFQDNFQAFSLLELLANIPQNLPATIRFVYSLVYIIQCGYFTYFFLKVRKDYISNIEPTLDADNTEFRLEWIKVAFFAALMEGVLAFFTVVLFPSFLSDLIFKTMTILFYILFPIYYINYSQTYNRVKALVDESSEGKENPIQSTHSSNKGEDEGMDILILKLIERNNILFQKAETFMQKEHRYLDNGMKPEDLVSALGTNRTYLANAIRQNRQQTISDYIMSYRLEHSQSVLQCTDLKMEEVALASGFNSLRTFNRNFKEHFGLTPEEFRNTTFQQGFLKKH